MRASATTTKTAAPTNTQSNDQPQMTHVLRMRPPPTTLLPPPPEAALTPRSRPTPRTTSTTSRPPRRATTAQDRPSRHLTRTRGLGTPPQSQQHPHTPYPVTRSARTTSH